jgi:hypothetical protein
MRRETSWGAAGLVAVAAAIGISSLPRPSNSPAPAQSNAYAASAGKKQREKQTKANSQTQAKANRVCSDLEDVLQAFFVTEEVSAPDDCLESASANKNKKNSPNAIPPSNIARPNELIDRAAHVKFVIGIVPDPIHTHFSLLFDRLTEAIQQGAQDQGYGYDSSWLPWETTAQDFPILADEDSADDRKSDREDEPGILLFRKTPGTSNNHSNGSQPPPKSHCDDSSEPNAYCDGLAVFVVGEEPTRGIHRKQFENAIKWIRALRYSNQLAPQISILGPTFSGSLPSLTELLSKRDKDRNINDYLVSDSELGHVLPIYSGSVTDKDSAQLFVKVSHQRPLNGLHISFHSFLQDDETTLDRFCHYLIENNDPVDAINRLAVISEDETAYGGSAQEEANLGTPLKTCMGNALYLYYPRDVAALRTAYQTQSILKPGSSGQSTDAPRTTLPTDIADPSGEEHDTIRSYGGDHTTISQESKLLAMVQVLRAHRIHNVVLVSSNSLDAIFLTSFMRRNYPDARVVILGADSLFQRDQGPSGLSGLMTLGTYPLMPWSQDWTDSSQASQSQREFPDYSAEAVYIATRMLLRPSGLCRAEVDFGPTFVPPLCGEFCKPLPDYALPAWVTDPSIKTNYQPATWLAVLGKNGFWPVAMLTDESLAPPTGEEPKPAPALYFPWGMKFALFILLGFAIVHAAGCWFASLTAKPAIRAHFANPGTWKHSVLIALGSAIIACTALTLWWGSGWLFISSGNPIKYPWSAAPTFLVVTVLSFVSLWFNAKAQKRLVASEEAAIRKSVGAKPLDQDFKEKLSRDLARDLAKRNKYNLHAHFFLGAATFLPLVGIFAASLHWVESHLLKANQVFAHWRAIFLGSGVSPIVPFLFLAAGLYLWFLNALHGLALFGSDRPQLPLRANLRLKDKNGKWLNVLAMFSRQNASSTEKVAEPLSNLNLGLVAGFFVLLLVIGIATGDGHVPIRNLGQTGSYSLLFCLLFALFFSMILADAAQLWSIWDKLRALLVFLDRTRLRRTLAALRGFSWGSVWKMSGNVLEVRYKLLSRQLESLRHIQNGLDEFVLHSDIPKTTTDSWEDMISKPLEAATKFAKWYSRHYIENDSSGLLLLRAFQVEVAAVTGKLMTQVLIPAWSEEGKSLILDTKESSDDSNSRNPRVPKDRFIRNCEELVCLTYLGFIQNILGRMRTVVMQITWLFIAATLSVACYPFDPRTALSLALLALFIATGVVITFVYAEMHKDATLSHVTNTDPGSLGSEFWLKLAAFGAGPVLGLLTTVFPGIAGFVFSWLQPGISSLK